MTCQMHTGELLVHARVYLRNRLLRAKNEGRVLGFESFRTSLQPEEFVCLQGFVRQKPFRVRPLKPGAGRPSRTNGLL